MKRQKELCAISLDASFDLLCSSALRSHVDSLDFNYHYFLGAVAFAGTVGLLTDNESCFLHHAARAVAYGF